MLEDAHYQMNMQRLDFEQASEQTPSADAELLRPNFVDNQLKGIQDRIYIGIEENQNHINRGAW